MSRRKLDYDGILHVQSFKLYLKVDSVMKSLIYSLKQMPADVLLDLGSFLLEAHVYLKCMYI